MGQNFNRELPREYKCRLPLSIFNKQERTPNSFRQIKTRRKSGRGWVIAAKDGIMLVRGYNPEFAQIETMYSYRSEVFASFASQIFLKTYDEYFQVPIKSKIISYCDNKAYVEGLTNFISDQYLTTGLFKKTEQEAYRIILQIRRSIKRECSSTYQCKRRHNNNKRKEKSTLYKIKVQTKIITKNSLIITTTTKTTTSTTTKILRHIERTIFFFQI